MNFFNEIKISELTEIKIEDLFRNVDPEDTFTIKQIFTALEDNNSKMARALLETAFECPLAPFIEESKKKCVRKPKELNRFEMCYIVQISKFITDARWDCLGKGEKQNENYSVAFCKTNSIKDIPISFSKEATVYLHSKTKKVKSFPPITLFDLLISILSEITFDGSPKIREQRKREINKRIKEMDSGKCKTYSWEEVKAQLKKKIKKKVKKWAADAEGKKQVSKRR